MIEGSLGFGGFLSLVDKAVPMSLADIPEVAGVIGDWAAEGADRIRRAFIESATESAPSQD